MARTRSLTLLLLLQLLLLLAPACQKASAPEAPKASEQSGEASETPVISSPIEARSGLAYQVFQTAGAEADAELPMVVAIHGLGSQPLSFGMLYAKIPTPTRVVLPQGPEPYSSGFSWFIFRKNDPDIVGFSRRLGVATDTMAAFLQGITALHKTSGKPLITGFSQGGMLSFTTAARHPELVSAALPISGNLPRPLIPDAASLTKPLPPIIALHGEADDVVPIDGPRDGIRFLREMGFDAQIHIYRGVAHKLNPVMVEHYHAWLARLLPGGEGIGGEALVPEIIYSSSGEPEAGTPVAEEPGTQTSP